MICSLFHSFYKHYLSDNEEPRFRAASRGTKFVALWSVFDGKTFVPDPTVNIIHREPERLEVITGGRGAGIYVLVPDKRPNGYPLWASEDGHPLFS